jgi:hypothetical protein
MFHTAANTPAWIVRGAGCLVVGALVVYTLITMSGLDALLSVAFFGVFAFGFTAVTGRSAAVAAVALAAGGSVGVLAAVVPGLGFMLWPPVPHSGSWAFAVVGAAGAVAAGVVAARLGGFRLWETVFSGLLGAVVAALLIWLVVVVMARFGPERWVPPMRSGALTPAARLSERRELAGEPYLTGLLVGMGLALTLGVLALRRGRIRTRPPVSPADRPGQIELGEVRPAG